jgi:hypothetical protein
MNTSQVSQDTYQTPGWMKPYTTGQKISHTQGYMAYADYHCVDGSANFDPEIEERIAFSSFPMVSYASRTGTRRNLDAMRAAN